MAFAAMAADQRQENLQPVDHAVKIDADIPLPFLRRQFGDRAAVDRDARIVAGDMQRAERLDGGLARAAHRSPVRHIGHDRDRLRAEPAHLARAPHRAGRRGYRTARPTCLRARKLRAIPRPMPDAAPVTIAVLPSSCCIAPLRAAAHSTVAASWTVAPLWSTVSPQNEQCVSRKDAWRGRKWSGCEAPGSGGRRGLRVDRRGRHSISARTSRSAPRRAWGRAISRPC